MLRTFLRSLGAGRVLYRSVYRPLAEWQTDDARMGRAAARLTAPSLPVAPSHWPSIRFLTGHRFWQQTAFCARSLEISLNATIRFEFVDDGSLTTAEARVLRRLFAGSRVILARESDARLNQYVPSSKYPLLHSRREQLPLMRKLLDLHAGFAGPSLALDSDMLFFRPADDLRGWLNNPTTARHLADAVESYVTERKEFEVLSGRPLAPTINTGLVALPNNSIDWNQMEDLLARLPEPWSTHRLLEQTLMGIHLTHLGSQPLPPHYRVLIHPFQSAPADNVMYHYCWDSNPIYRRSEWRRFLQGPYALALRR